MVKITHPRSTSTRKKIRKVYLQFIDGTTVDLARYFQALQKRGLLRDLLPEAGGPGVHGNAVLLFPDRRDHEGGRDNEKDDGAGRGPVRG